MEIRSPEKCEKIEEGDGNDLRPALASSRPKRE